jgi:hypothetical protein
VDARAGAGMSAATSKSTAASFSLVSSPVGNSLRADMCSRGRLIESTAMQRSSLK